MVNSSLSSLVGILWTYYLLKIEKIAHGSIFGNVAVYLFFISILELYFYILNIALIPESSLNNLCQ